MNFSFGAWFGKKNNSENTAESTAEQPPATEAEAPEEHAAFVRREAVFNRSQRIIGHLYRLQLADAGFVDAPSERQKPLDELLLKSLCLGREENSWGQLIGFVPLSTVSLDNSWLDRLPTSNTVLLLTLAAETSNLEALATRLKQLRERGIKIGVFRQPKHPAFTAVLEAADFAAVNVADSQGGNVRDFSVALRSTLDVKRLIELFGANIETVDDQSLCQRCHFSYFHGPFAKSESAWEKPKGDPHKLNLIRLLNLAQGEAEIAELSNALKEDPLLTFRILRYLNSPAIGLTREITSIDQALMVLGRQRLARWLSILVFSVKEPDFTDWLLIESALSRGRIIELLGQQRFPEAQSDHLFLTGIFSTLDKLLRIPLPEALQQLHLPANIRNALLEHAGPYAPLLAIAEACEAFDPPRISSAARAAGLNPADVNQALLAATAWASEVTAHWD